MTSVTTVEAKGMEIQLIVDNPGNNLYNFSRVDKLNIRLAATEANVILDTIATRHYQCFYHKFNNTKKSCDWLESIFCLKSWYDEEYTY